MTKKARRSWWNEVSDVDREWRALASPQQNKTRSAAVRVRHMMAARNRSGVYRSGEIWVPTLISLEVLRAAGGQWTGRTAIKFYKNWGKRRTEQAREIERERGEERERKKKRERFFSCSLIGLHPAIRTAVGMSKLDKLLTQKEKIFSLVLIGQALYGIKKSIVI